MKEEQIRPREIFDEYLRLSIADAETMFDAARFEPIACPGCQSEQFRPAFVKNRFSYVECGDCDSLYQSPRPTAADLERFYTKSESSEYWSKSFFPSVAEVRRDKIIRPKVERIGEICQKMGITPKSVLDVGAGHGTFLEEWQCRYGPTARFAVEPSESMAKTCTQKGIETLQCTSEEAASWSNKAELVTCFEVIEHVHDCFAFVKSIFNLTKQGGIAIVTGLGVDGFDIQLLWNEAKSINPPHHLNFMSVSGFKTLFTRAGFESVDVITPGVLDLEIASSGSDLRFLKTLNKRGAKAAEAFQLFLQQHQLSSHVWVIAKKSGGANQ